MNRPAKTEWKPRLAVEADIPAIGEIIPLSVRELQTEFYSTAQMEAAIGTLFDVDRQLIRDRTYFVVAKKGLILGCGGWSRRTTLSGGDRMRTKPDAELDPSRDAARIRAFFIHPSWARRGVGRSIMRECERAIIEAGFKRVEIVATLAGEKLYATFGYATVEHYELPMAGGLGLPVVKMKKNLTTDESG